MLKKILAFLISGALVFLGVLSILGISAMNFGVVFTILAGLLGGTLNPLVYKYLQGYFDKDDNSPEKKYEFKFKQYPNEGWRYFSVTANDPDEADRKAAIHFQNLVKERRTVLSVFYPTD